MDLSSENGCVFEPVRDIRVKGKVSVNDLIRMMGDSGGFTSQKLADAVDALNANV